MVKVGDLQWYEDKTFLTNLNIYLDSISENDDLVVCVDGKEGAGKSLRLRQIAAYCADYLGSTFNNDNIKFDLQKYMDFSIESPPNTVCVLDESRNQLNRKNSMTKIVKRFTSFLSECRKYKQVHIIALPAYHDLDRYVVSWRMKFLVHLHKWFEADEKAKSGFKLARGKYTLYINDNYLKDSYNYPYRYPLKWVTKGRFNNVEILSKEDLKKYEDEKDANIETRYHSKHIEADLTKTEKMWKGRWVGLVKGITDNTKITYGDIGEYCDMLPTTVRTNFVQSQK